MGSGSRRSDGRDEPASLGDELHAARMSTGLSLEAVGDAVDMSREKVRRIERGLAAGATIGDLTAVATAVGLDLSVKLYPGGRPLRDIVHVRLLGRFHARIHPSLGWQPETPVPLPGDRRAWDAMIRGTRFRLGVEAESRLGDLQALERRVALKARDSRIEQVVLLVADTRHNRDALRAAGPMLSSFPLSARSIPRSLAVGREPGGSGIVVL